MTKRVQISAFKSRLSAHLNEVRRGAKVIILDRDHPIAQVIPLKEPKKRKLTVRPAKIQGRWGELSYHPVDRGIDVVRLLREDRDRR